MGIGTTHQVTKSAQPVETTATDINVTLISLLLHDAICKAPHDRYKMALRLINYRLWPVQDVPYLSLYDLMTLFPLLQFSINVVGYITLPTAGPFINNLPLCGGTNLGTNLNISASLKTHFLSELVEFSWSKRKQKGSISFRNQDRETQKCKATTKVTELFMNKRFSNTCNHSYPFNKW